MNNKPNNITHTLFTNDGHRVDVSDIEVKLLGILRKIGVTGTFTYGVLTPVDRFVI